MELAELNLRPYKTGMLLQKYGRVAQLVERYLDMVEVPGSSPVAPTKLFSFGDCFRFASGAFEDAFAH